MMKMFSNTHWRLGVQLRQNKLKKGFPALVFNIGYVDLYIFGAQP